MKIVLGNVRTTEEVRDMANRGWPGEFSQSVDGVEWFWCRADRAGMFPFEVPTTAVLGKPEVVCIQAKGHPVHSTEAGELVLPGLFMMTRQIEIARFLGAKTVVFDGYRDIDGVPFTEKQGIYLGHVENMINAAKDAMSNPAEFSYQSRHYRMPAVGVI